MAGSGATFSGKELVEGLNLELAASLAPFVAREHRGMKAFDFLSGKLTASGKVMGDEPAGSFTADLSAREGRLLPGSELQWHSAGSSSLHYQAAVTNPSATPIFGVAIQGRDVVLGERQEGPPLIASRSLSITTHTIETRLSALLGRAKEVRAENEPAPLVGDAVAEGIELDLPGDHFRSRLAIDQATARLDLGAVLHRDLR
jgi:hypothetical protein